MRATAAALALPAVLAAGAIAHAGTPPAPPATLGSVRVVDCSRASHAADFYARLRGVSQTSTMWMRFTLLERMGTAPFQPLNVPGLETWRKSQPHRRAFGVHQRVRNLLDGHAYRMRVDFRWYDADGNILRRARVRSGLCRQFGPRPNLQVQVVGAEKTDVAGVLRYSVNVSNTGHTGATNAGVRLAVDGAEVNTKTIALLGRGETRPLSFRGPACQQTVEATADPANLIPESSETDNSQSRPCSEIRP